MSRDDEAQLVRRAKQGDQAAFAEIYTRHHDAVYAYLYYRVNDVQVAEDLTGEVFLRLVAKMDRYTYRGRPILAWMYTIARNLLIDHQRKQAQAGMFEDVVRGLQYVGTRGSMGDLRSKPTRGRRTRPHPRLFDQVTEAPDRGSATRDSAQTDRRTKQRRGR